MNRRHRVSRPFSLVAICLSALAGCLQIGQPVIAERSPVFKPPTVVRQGSARSVAIHTVRRGDTLYSIAWRYELDYLGLARANGVAAPYLIHPGQTMRLITQLPRSKRIVARSRPAAVKPPPAPPSPSLKWVWPLAQKPDVEYGKSSKGLDFRIQGRPGTPVQVRAAGAGEVVYAGNGIGGFERLVIIKHSGELLSAYSFDGHTRVKERQWVKAGEGVADIKIRNRKRQTLHFELRRKGEPINPRSVLQ